MHAINLSNQTYILDASKKVPGEDPELYRHTLNFSFDANGLADGIKIVEAPLSGRFAGHEYDLPAGTLSGLGSAVAVTLPSPRRVRRINVQNTAFGDDPRKIELYRVDVKTLAEAPTLTVDDDTDLGDDFSDVRFALMRQGGKSLGTSQVLRVQVRSEPASPRLGVAVGGDLAEVVYFWQGTDEIEGADLAGTLGRFLNRHLAALAEAGAPKPAEIDVTLVLESRAPCRVTLDTLRVEYRLVTNTWTDSLPQRDAEKWVLRFPGDRLDSRSLEIALPAGATVQAATLRAVESQAQAPLQAADGGENGPSALANPSPTEKTGLHVAAGRWIAQTIEPGQALTASRLVLGLLPLVEGTELTVALQASWNDQPSGGDLAAGTLVLGQPGRAVWATLALPEPITLNTGAYWLMLTASQGQALWLAKTGAGTAKLWRRADAKRPWTRIGDLSGHQLLYQLLSPRPAPAQVAGGSPSPPAESSCRLTAGTQTVSPASRDGDTVHYDLAPALNAYLVAARAKAQTVAELLPEAEPEPIPEVEPEPMPATGGTAVVEAIELTPIPLTFAALGLKQASVFPPRIEYTISAS